MEEDTVVSLDFDNELLYKNMVDAKADWLYNLPAWDRIFDAEKKKELYREAKKMNTIVKGPKVGQKRSHVRAEAERNTSSAADGKTPEE